MATKTQCRWRSDGPSKSSGNVSKGDLPSYQASRKRRRPATTESIESDLQASLQRLVIDGRSHPTPETTTDAYTTGCAGSAVSSKEKNSSTGVLLEPLVYVTNFGLDATAEKLMVRRLMTTSCPCSGFVFLFRRNYFLVPHCCSC